MGKLEKRKLTEAQKQRKNARRRQLNRQKGPEQKKLESEKAKQRRLDETPEQKAARAQSSKANNLKRAAELKALREFKRKTLEIKNDGSLHLSTKPLQVDASTQVNLCSHKHENIKAEQKIKLKNVKVIRLKNQAEVTEEIGSDYTSNDSTIIVGLDKIKQSKSAPQLNQCQEGSCASMESSKYSVKVLLKNEKTNSTINDRPFSKVESLLNETSDWENTYDSNETESNNSIKTHFDDSVAEGSILSTRNSLLEPLDLSCKNNKPIVINQSSHPNKKIFLNKVNVNSLGRGDNFKANIIIVNPFSWSKNSAFSVVDSAKNKSLFETANPFSTTNDASAADWDGPSTSTGYSGITTYEEIINNNWANNCETDSDTSDEVQEIWG